MAGSQIGIAKTAYLHGELLNVCAHALTSGTIAEEGYSVGEPEPKPDGSWLVSVAELI